MEYSHLTHPIKSVRKWTRRQWRTVGNTPMWKQLKEVSGDELALRELMLRSHGIETLQNFIFGAHGRPNKW